MRSLKRLLEPYRWFILAAALCALSDATIGLWMFELSPRWWLVVIFCWPMAQAVVLATWSGRIHNREEKWKELYQYIYHSQPDEKSWQPPASE